MPGALGPGDRVGVTNVEGDTDTRATAGTATAGAATAGAATAGADAGVAGAAGADTAAVNGGGCTWLSAATNRCPTSPVGACARCRLALLVCNHWGS